jgi:hypothetical protein
MFFQQRIEEDYNVFFVINNQVLLGHSRSSQKVAVNWQEDNRSAKPVQTLFALGLLG